VLGVWELDCLASGELLVFWKQLDQSELIRDPDISAELSRCSISKATLKFERLVSRISKV
jgi:hypothetical protein